MIERTPRVRFLHRHRPVTRHVLTQRSGVPYMVERTVCAECDRLLAERPVGRTAA